MTVEKIYAGFLGEWQLDVAESHYGQGEAPVSGGYAISESQEGLVFVISWQDSDGKDHSFSFSGIPDGEARPFAGDDLIDSMSVSVPHPNELTSKAFFKGRELMTARRVLVEDGAVMEITQSVVLPDGSQPANVARYRRKLHS
ncbi:MULTISPECIES: hypothetical protein [Kordiimonas]|uniref:Lipocalin-like domain-containing protein n=1 Tax=Kordiimonas lacus TaxID=637679 RepID=A0A1G6VL39_9PROT|nr:MULTISPECIES: hypothetical protein [Kordiimonas]SDD54244.1 hypothetical protein SAMN04488071_0767 [Kordiimonas lacus]